MRHDSQAEMDVNAEALTPFEVRISASSPQPREAFEQELSQRLQYEVTQRSSHTKRALIPMLPRRIGRLSRSTIILLIILLVVGVGVVIAMSASLRQAISFDAGLKAILDQGLGHEIGISQSIEDFTVTLEWAYA